MIAQVPWRQRDSECALAAACVVGGQDYVTASDLFREVHGGPWWNRGAPGGVGTWARERWLPFVRAYVCPGYPAGAMFRKAVSGAGAGRPGPETRFVVVQLVRDGVAVVQHVMAYADGVVEDGASGVTGPLEEVMAQYYPGWTVAAYLGLGDAG